MRRAFFLLCLAVFAFSVSMVEGDYAVGGDYVTDRGPSPWEALGAPQSTFEYRLLYLLQSDKELKELWYGHPDNLTGRQSRQISLAVDYLDEVLVGTYAQAIKLFRYHPNRPLLKMMLAHHHLYINSANESWPEVIAALAKFDPKLAREVAKEARPRWKEQIDPK